MTKLTERRGLRLGRVLAGLLLLPLAACVPPDPVGLDRELPWEHGPVAVSIDYHEALREAPSRRADLLKRSKDEPLNAVFDLKRREEALQKGEFPELAGAARTQEIERLAREYDKVTRLPIKGMLEWYFQSELEQARLALEAVTQFNAPGSLVAQQVQRDVLFESRYDPGIAESATPRAILRFEVRNTTPYDLRLKRLFADPYAFGGRLGIECFHLPPYTEADLAERERGGRSYRETPEWFIKAGAVSTERFHCRTGAGRDFESAYLDEALVDVKWVVEMREGELLLPASGRRFHFDKTEPRKQADRIYGMEGMLREVRSWDKKRD